MAEVLPSRSVTELSHRRTRLRINGEDVTGFPEDDPPIEIENEDLVEYMFGSDGTLYLEDTAIQGGEVTLTLGPSSPYVPKLIQYQARIRRGESIPFLLTYGDSSAAPQYEVTCAGGALMKCDSVPRPGENFEATFVFETIIGEATGTVFHGPPPADGRTD